MDLIYPFGLILFGFSALILSADLLVQASISIAARFKISPALIGLTLVAAGTSAPELFTCLSAAFKGKQALSIGNILGSNVFNICAVLGITALICPISILKNTWHKEWQKLTFATTIFIALAINDGFSLIDGLILIALLCYFIALSYKNRNKNNEDESNEPLKMQSSLLDILYLLLGFTGLLIGSEIGIDGAVRIGHQFNINEKTIGILVLALGTSLPELFTSIVAAFQKREDLAISNIIGSNLFNTLGVVGTTAIIQPLTINFKNLAVDFSVLILATMLMGSLLFIRSKKITRPIGSIFFIFYAIYVSYLLLQ